MNSDRPIFSTRAQVGYATWGKYLGVLRFESGRVRYYLAWLIWQDRVHGITFVPAKDPPKRD